MCGLPCCDITACGLACLRPSAKRHLSSSLCHRSAAGLQDVGAQDGGSDYEPPERSPPIEDFIVEEGEDEEESGVADGGVGPR